MDADTASAHPYPSNPPVYSESLMSISTFLCPSATLSAVEDCCVPVHTDRDPEVLRV